MNNLGKITNHHLIITNVEQEAIINALAFFHEFFSEADVNLNDWINVAQDQRIELFDQLATKVATL